MNYESEANSQQRSEQSESISSYLDSADEARVAGRSRLAVHLYCAAFELALEQGLAPTERILDGMNQAWLLACEQGDNSSAETIFNDLLPYHSPEQTEEALKQLQHLAFNQLEKLGVPHDEIADLAHTLVQEVSQDFSQETSITSQNTENTSRKINLTRILSELETQIIDASEATDVLAASVEQNQKDVQVLRFSTLTGFNETLRAMRQFGFTDGEDSHFREFLAQANAFHGVMGPVLTNTFFFYGPNRDDVALFARATAGEIGWPTIEVAIELANKGIGTIKVTGPVKRSLFAPPRLTDLPRPCILLIQNIDLLQELFRGEEMYQGYRPIGSYGDYSGPQGMGSQGSQNPQGMGMGSQGMGMGPQGSQNPQGMGIGPQGMGMGPQGIPNSRNPLFGAGSLPTHIHRSMKAEILTHLNALLIPGNIFVIVTAQQALSEQPLLLGGELLNVIGSYREIEVPGPTLAERVEILRWFSQDHPSFQDIDFEYVARLAQGVARNEIVWAAQASVEEAYRKSLHSGHYQTITSSEVLSQIITLLDADSPYRAGIEDAIVEQFSNALNNALNDGLLDLF